jgi:hypothetical protein
MSQASLTRHRQEKQEAFFDALHHAPQYARD